MIILDTVVREMPEKFASMFILRLRLKAESLMLVSRQRGVLIPLSLAHCRPVVLGECWVTKRYIGAIKTALIGFP